MRRLGRFLELHCPRLWGWTWARYYCPRPIGDAVTARQCFEAGYCGCDNATTYRHQRRI
jgi:hypothetical protein